MTRPSIFAWLNFICPIRDKATYAHQSGINVFNSIVFAFYATALHPFLKSYGVLPTIVLKEN